SKAATDRLGVGNLEALHQGALRGYSGGGLVGGGPVPRPAEGQSAAPVVTINAPVTVNASGGTPEANQDLARQVARESENMIRGIVQTELVRQMRPGGIMRR